MARLRHPGQICDSRELVDGGRGLRFEIPGAHGPEPAFVVRYQGVIHAYYNRCAHKAVELDWDEGEFFDRDREHLICATHGALYDPVTGQCVSGPCAGQRLTPITIEETEGVVRLANDVG